MKLVAMEKEYELHLEIKGEQASELLFSNLQYERLLRLNPYWVIKELKEEGGDYFAQCEDHETNEPFSFSGCLRSVNSGGVTIEMKGLPWQSISLFERDSVLWARVVFETEPDEKEEQKLIYWLRSIREYMRLYATTSLWTRMHRYLMNKVLLPMTPSQRKISLMLVRLSILEVVIILIIVVGYFYFN